MKKKVLLITITLVMVFYLTGCKTAGNDVPIPSKNLWFLGNFIDAYIARPIAWFLKFTSETFGDYGLGILIATVVIRLVTWPVYSSMNTLTAKMSLAQPEMTRLQEKYIGKNDPESRKKMQMEMMGIYKKYKINFMGCLAPFIQMPLFIGTYTAIRRFGATYTDIDMKFFGIDLTLTPNSGNISAWVIAILMFILMLVQTYVMQKKPKALEAKKYQTTQNEQMQKQMKIMYYVFAGMMLMMAISSPAALSFYWIVGSIFTIVQNLVNKATMESRMEKLKNRY